MSKLYLLLLFCTAILRTSGQVGELAPTFGKNGIQTTAFFSNINQYSEYMSEMLTNANGDIFVVSIFAAHYTRIAKYLPDGKRDSSYGNAGLSDTMNLDGTSATLQGDKIIVVGSIDNDFTLVRYTANGKLDPTFGKNGKVTTDFHGSWSNASSIALHEDKIIVGGTAGNPVNNISAFALARYSTDGVLDSSFGVNGIVITDFNNAGSWINSIVLQGDKIIVNGSIDNTSALVRYSADGTLDSSFGEYGIVTTKLIVNAISLQRNKIVVAGYIYNEQNYTDFILARYTADGTLDASFGENGKVTTDFGSPDDYANAIAIQGNHIIVAGYTNDPDYFYNDFALARYTANGTLDSSFGKNGKVTTDFNNHSNDISNTIVIQGSNILVAGNTYNTDKLNEDIALARYTANGRLDPSFGENGKLTAYFGASDTHFTSTAMQGDKIIAAGYAVKAVYDFGYYRNNYDFVLARYTADGTLDSSFGENGKVTTEFGSSDDYATSIVLQGDKILVAGGNGKFALARYTADGTLDSAFGEYGKVTTVINYIDDGANSIALQGDKIILAGYTYYGAFHEHPDFALARYTANGRLDASFGEHGIVITDFNNSDDKATSIALQGDKIIVAGNTTNNSNGGSSNFALARYTANGKLDPSFGENGKLITDFNNSDDFATSIALQGDKIIVAGDTYNPVDYTSSFNFALARYSANGVLDPSFGEHGEVITNFDSTSIDEANAIVLQGDKIIVGGNSGLHLALARYTANGRLDASFGENGKVVTDLSGYSKIQNMVLHEDRLYAVGSITPPTDETFGIIAAYQLEAPVPAEPVVSIADVTVPESKKLAVVTVRLSKPATKLVRVQFTTRNKTATSPEDYTPVKGTLFFIPGVNTAFKIFIPIVNGNEPEATEQFEVRLTKAWNATILDSVGVVTITGDDAQITKQGTSLRIQASPNPAVAAFTIQLQGTNYKQPVSVRVYDVNGKLLEERKDISIGQSLRLGDLYKAGTYIIEALQGSQSVQTKVIKTGK